MPVTIQVSAHGANGVDFRYTKPADSALALLQGAAPGAGQRCRELLQSSFGTKLGPQILPSSNGFVKGVVRAYNQHHHLRIRPDDVWFAILTQLSTYVNGHAEELRGQFVAHQGQEELTIVYERGSRYTVDMGMFANEMGLLLGKKVVDRELREWLMPAFSTTTADDTVAASVVMMGAMQKYFSYRLMTLCGIPSVTLLGEKRDWELILARLGKLRTWGEEPARFHDLLRPVVTRFVKHFEEPGARDIADFWQQVVSHISEGSGAAYYSGWITAFCFWDEEGKCLYDLKRRPWYGGYENLYLDGVKYHMIETDDVPPGWVSVPVKIDDNGLKLDATMVAGSVGIRCTGSAGGADGDQQQRMDSVVPEIGWWMFEHTEVKGEVGTGDRVRGVRNTRPLEF